MSRVLAKWAINGAKQRAEAGEAVTPEHLLELIESHENLRSAYEDALRRATGHAYATAMAEGGEEIQHQELTAERKAHAETLTERRRYEAALMSIAKNTCCDPCQEARRVASAALNESNATEGQ